MTSRFIIYILISAQLQATDIVWCTLSSKFKALEGYLAPGVGVEGTLYALEVYSINYLHGRPQAQ